MSGIYIHIPFCKQACHYCDFHFSTTLKHQQQLVDALCLELESRKRELTEPIQTVYFGGGTPSLLTALQLHQILNTVYKNYSLAQDLECTLEANPDDISQEILIGFKKAGINRISLGIQSFFEDDLQFINRAHSATEAKQALEGCLEEFENVSIDLIYGVPGMNLEKWVKNLALAFKYKVPHLSCYALTVEPGTALAQFIKKGKVAPVSEQLAAEHYNYLLQKTREQEYTNYEFSNFGKRGYWSKNNMAYWQGKPYLGIGPGAHSYSGKTRSWNLPNNPKYIKSWEQGQRLFQSETLSKDDQFNEYLMTGLRTIWGVSLDKITQEFGTEYAKYILEQLDTLANPNAVEVAENVLTVAPKAKFLTDGIAAHLFMVR